MAMKFSKQHEREEARLLRKGHIHSWIGLVLSWLPLVGLLFAAGGFFRCKVRLTRKYRRRRAVYLAFASLVLAVAVGVGVGELWVYSRDPQILTRIGQNAWSFIVGKNEDVTGASPSGTAYTDMDTAGLGVTDGSLQEESDGLDGDFTDWDEDFSDWDDGFDWDAWDDEGWTDVSDDTWPEEAGADWYIDDSWDFKPDDLFWTEEDISETDDGMDWDLDALFEAEQTGENEGKSFSVGKGEVILPLTE